MERGISRAESERKKRPLDRANYRVRRLYQALDSLLGGFENLDSSARSMTGLLNSETSESLRNLFLTQLASDFLDQGNEYPP